jgi:oxygen-independent coproporphyrinogen-3 oxidase
MAGLYIHLPFCSKKCPYCAFVSAPFSKDEEELYVNAVIKEMELIHKEGETSSWKFKTLYAGGGTPTCLETKNLITILENAFTLFFSYPQSCEVTIEGNPESATPEKLKTLKDTGVNRLSLGFQSLSEEGLKALGRSHTVNQAVNAYEDARRTGFENINIDLIYGWPGQDVNSWKRDLELLTPLSPEHISCYELTIEPGTPFSSAYEKGILKLPEEEEILSMMEITEEFLSTKGYRQYEISNFAREGYACIHNLNYWNNSPYSGIGCSSVSYIPPKRRKNTDDLATYAKKLNSFQLPVHEEESLDLEARFRETVIIKLRTTDGLNLTEIRQKFAIDIWDYYDDLLKRNMELNLMETVGDRLFLTKKGRRIANFVLKDLV